MRNPLARLLKANRDVSVRDRFDDVRSRFADTRDRASKAIAVAKILMKPKAPKPAPVDRAALVNYITFLSLERAKCADELYPHMSWHARRFTLSMNAAWRFFHDGNNSLNDREGLAPASTRALQVLDLVGIDWREDTDESSRRRFDDAGRTDTGQRLAEPRGTPAADAVAVEAFDNLTRLDRAIDALGGGDRDTDDVPGYEALDAARSEALSVLERVSPETLIGLRAKARAILCDSLKGDPTAIEDLARSLACDLLGARHSALEPRPDPILALIDEAWRLTRKHGQLHAICAAKPVSDPSWEPANEAHDAMWEHIRGVLLKTVPRTAEGCRALAQFVVDFNTDQGVTVEYDSNDPAFALIARSPLL